MENKSILLSLNLLNRLEKNHQNQFRKMITLSPRIVDYESEILNIFNNCSVKNIEYINLPFLKLDQIKNLEKYEKIFSLKNQGLVSSIGIFCQFINDAISIARFTNKFSHLIVPVSIFTSPDLIKVLFKTTRKNNIAVFCYNPFSKENYLSEEKDSYKFYNPIFDLLLKGKNTIIDRITNNSNKNFKQFSIRYLLDFPFQSILVNMTSSTEVDFFLKSLRNPQLNGSELLLIQKSIDPEVYFESPKKAKIEN